MIQSNTNAMQNHQPPSPPTPKHTTITTTATTTATTTTTPIIYIIIAASLFSLLFILSLSTSQQPPSRLPQRPNPFLFPNRHNNLPNNPPQPPSLAYVIHASRNQLSSTLRLLHALYHPKNHYLLHLDRLASQSDRDLLARTVQSHPIFQAAQNVHVLGKSDFAYPKGSSPISAMLHAASVLLRLVPNWDWFISLTPHDYPLVPQDDLLHIMSYLPRNMNFVNHTSYIGRKELRKLKPIIVDPGLYIYEKSPMFYATQKRELPSAFRLFSGWNSLAFWLLLEHIFSTLGKQSHHHGKCVSVLDLVPFRNKLASYIRNPVANWIILGSSFAIYSRNFIEHCIVGTDNLPRTILMYLANTPSSLSIYLPTILCNSCQFNRTVVNNNLVYTAFDEHSRARMLTSNDFDDMIKSGAPFASGFREGDPVLERIDREILNRNPDTTVPGGWCLGDSRNDTCLVWGDADVLRPGPGAKRLENFMVELLSDGRFRSHQCIIE